MVTLAAGAAHDASGGAVAVVAAHQRVVAERLALAHAARRAHRLRGADALARHLVAQPPTALTRCGTGPRGQRDTETEFRDTTQTGTTTQTLGPDQTTRTKHRITATGT